MKMLIGCTHPQYGYLECKNCSLAHSSEGIAICKKMKDEKIIVHEVVELDNK